MRDIATATLTGNLTREVELRPLPSGTEVARLLVQPAVDRDHEARHVVGVPNTTLPSWTGRPRTWSWARGPRPVKEHREPRELRESRGAQAMPRALCLRERAPALPLISCALQKSRQLTVKAYFSDPSYANKGPYTSVARSAPCTAPLVAESRPGLSRTERSRRGVAAPARRPIPSGARARAKVGGSGGSVRLRRWLEYRCSHDST